MAINKEAKFLTAAKKGQIKALQRYLACGVDPDITDLNGDTALLHLAYSHNRAAPDCIQALLTTGANAKVVNSSGFNALMFAAATGQSDTLETLLAVWPEGINSRSRDGSTPLMFAASRDITFEHLRRGTSVDCYQVLMAAGADVKAANIDDFNAILFASASGQTGALEVLLKAWPEGVNSHNKDGSTPLMLAAFHLNLSCVYLLVAAGAVLHKMNCSGKTALSIAGDGGPYGFTGYEESESNSHKIVTFLRAQMAAKEMRDCIHRNLNAAGVTHCVEASPKPPFLDIL